MNLREELLLKKSNFYFSRCIAPKRVMSLRGPSSRHCAGATQLFPKKYCSGGEPLVTLSPIGQAQDLNFRPPAPETNALPQQGQNDV